jgi:hypothetical protein
MPTILFICLVSLDSTDFRSWPPAQATTVGRQQSASSAMVRRAASEGAWLGEAGRGVPFHWMSAIDLDGQYPKLSQLVEAECDVTLEQLANRAPAVNYKYFDLERLLAHAVRDARTGPAGTLLAPYATQVLGYLATLEAYIALNVIKSAHNFVVKKLMVPQRAGPPPAGAEMLDTLVECSWAIWLHDRYGNLEEEKRLPGGVGDADFFVTTTAGPLWVDCISVAPKSEQVDLGAYFSKVVIRKWKRKFGGRPGAAQIAAAIAVTVLKNQENIIGQLHFDQTVGNVLMPTNTVWTDCAALQAAWLALPPFHDVAHRPDLFATWTRP